MHLLENRKKEDYVIIIGCGRLGANIANTLSDNDEDVLIMDTQKNAFRRLTSDFGGLSVVANGTDMESLNNAQIKRATSVIAVTNHDNTNIMIAQIARDVFHVDNVIARLYDPERESVYQALGIKTICPAALSAKEVDKILEKHGEKVQS